MQRSITAEEFSTVAGSATAILDVRRADDLAAATDTVPGARWQDPADIENWIDTVPTDGQVIIYCVRGGGVSNSVVDRLQAAGVNAQYIEGGIAALQAAGVALQAR